MKLLSLILPLLMAFHVGIPNRIQPGPYSLGTLTNSGMLTGRGGSFSHTIASGESLIVLTAAGIPPGQAGSITSFEVGTFTYAGIQLTKVARYAQTLGLGSRQIDIWYLQNPTVGTNTVSWSDAGTTGEGFYALAAISYKPKDSVGETISNEANPDSSSTITFTNQRGPALLLDAIVLFDTSLTANSNQTVIGSVLTSGTNKAIGFSYRQNAAPSSSMNWSITGSSNLLHAGSGIYLAMTTVTPSRVGTPTHIENP